MELMGVKLREVTPRTNTRAHGLDLIDAGLSALQQIEDRAPRNKRRLWSLVSRRGNMRKNPVQQLRSRVKQVRLRLTLLQAKLQDPGPDKVSAVITAIYKVLETFSLLTGIVSRLDTPEGNLVS